MTWAETAAGHMERRRGELIREMSPKARPCNSYWYRCLNLGATPDYVNGQDEGESGPGKPSKSYPVVVRYTEYDTEVETLKELPNNIF